MRTADLTLHDWAVAEWLGAGSADLATEDLVGRVVLAGAFQMLCPGCVSQTIPQLTRVAATFPRDRVAVVGLHSVFEHHDAMTPHALRAFLHEYAVGFPVAVDAPAPDGGPVPQTMQRFSFRGTPTLLLFDATGRLRRQVFGHLADLQLGAEIARLEGESGSTSLEVGAPSLQEPGCDESGCRR
ncbi:TlpA disulfide reductase family protein [Nocardioides lijunqiniae]|uniref:TlpA disulfide reductase family protein n=1 Tax=Nocardioides lijunqiniae TaxID=2760832 RepID=UPI001D0C6EA8|nr:TlpA disulfide reductase family protein [Nocardioides lijunqiniae]